MRCLQERGTVVAALTNPREGQPTGEAQPTGGAVDASDGMAVARRPRARLLLALAVAAVVVAADQATKQWALDRLSHGPIHVIGPLDFELTRNTGSAFSLLQGQRVLLVLVAVVVGAALLAFAARAHRPARAVEVGLIVGGAAGNLVDRLARGDHGAVVDFVALRVWPTFNLADSCIVVGCVLLGWTLLRRGAEA